MKALESKFVTGERILHDMDCIALLHCQVFSRKCCSLLLGYATLGCLGTYVQKKKMCVLYRLDQFKMRYAIC